MKLLEPDQELALSDALNEDAFQYYARLQRVKRFVEENYSEEISLDTAAGIAGMERTSFSRFFSSKVGVSFTQWLTRTRIAKARNLMKKSNYSISEITYTVGFSNLRTFEKAFKKLTDLTPSEFKVFLEPLRLLPTSLLYYLRKVGTGSPSATVQFL